MAKMGAAKYNPQIRKVFDIAVETFSNLLRNQRLLALSDGYTGNKITIVIKLHRLFPIAVGGSHFFV